MSTFATTDKASIDDNFWNTINSLGDHNWFEDVSDALFEAKATELGEPFVCGDGKIKLTPFIYDGSQYYEDGTEGYLIEDLREPEQTNDMSDEELLKALGL